MTAVDLTVPVGQPLDLAAFAARKESPVAVKTPIAAPSGFSFGDFIDVINPLQHIPGIAELYRSVTNDQISTEARKTGNALYGFALGGPVGLGAMLAYNALGDRLEGGEAAPVAEPQLVAETRSPAGEVQELPDVPVPPRKPGPEEVPASPPGGQSVLLVETTTKTGEVPMVGAGLGALFETGSADRTLKQNDVRIDGAASATAASSVAYVERTDPDAAEAPVVPTDAGLGQLATHQSNRLPLDVLKALQERHAQRSASERS
ncbi:hypothetical protein [Labrenzia sp. VG12]|uniref:hypothetical protein n=1 Tax=Labrenzia sp. VG12 TaxID=2021862 RepID=UPI000B8BC473|nr:hypothetical protein [Labrenzia sp. VG12]ASP32935.1 hypothetical protein CHH27_06455 [Labrenzia sp. VG12]